MRYFHLTVVGLLLAGMHCASQADELAGKEQPKGSTKATAEGIDRFIMQLGDDDSTKRLQARKQLEAIGEPAVVSLKKAAESSDDPEVRKASKQLLEKFDAKARGEMSNFNVGRTRVNGVAFSADGKRAVSASWDGLIRYWDLGDHTLIRQIAGHRNDVNGAAISPDGKRVLSGGSDRTMRLWDLETGAEIRQFVHPPATVWDVAFSPDGKSALSGCMDGNARLWDVESGKLLRTLETYKDGVAWTVAFTPDGKQVVTGGGNSHGKPEHPGGSLRQWDLATGKEIRRFEGHTKDVRHVAISPDGKQMLSAGFDGTVRLWDLQTAKELKRFDGPSNFVESVCFASDGKRAVCSYGQAKTAAVRDEESRCSLKLWDLSTGKELKLFKGHVGTVLSLAVSRNGEMLLSGSVDGSMRLWEMPK